MGGRSAGTRGIGSVAVRILVAGSLAAGGPIGCQPGQNLFATQADANDACGTQHAAFADSKSFYLQEVAQGAIIGAIGGAAIGALGAAATGGSAGKGALIGGGAGAVVGGAAGYFNAQQQQNADRAQLQSSIYNDINKASTEMDRATTTFGNLRDCRFREAKRIKAAVRSGSLARDQGVAQLADQKKRFDDEIVLARQYGAKMNDQDQQFRFASDSLIKDDPEAKQIMARRARLAPTAPARAPVAAGDLVATASVNVRSGPSASADKVGSLAAGEGVQLGSEAPANGWQQVVLADGTTGYVASRYLSGSGGAVAAATPSRPPLNSNNKDAQVAVAATETIPEKRAAYSKAVDDATQQASLSFNLDQASPTG
jgi:SH3-like domain-containing protein/outer membrane lipoprotein SlyB